MVEIGLTDLPKVGVGVGGGGGGAHALMAPPLVRGLVHNAWKLPIFSRSKDSFGLVLFP